MTRLITRSFLKSCIGQYQLVYTVQSCTKIMSWTDPQCRRVEIKKSSVYYDTAVLWQNRSGFYLMLSLQINTVQTDCKITPYCHIFRVNVFFSAFVLVLHSPNLKVFYLNFIIKARISLIAPQRVPYPSCVKRHLNKELKY